jgi:hypothetical protein
MAPKEKSISSRLPEIMAQITQALSESFDKMTDGLLSRLQSQGKELAGEVSKEVEAIKTDVGDVKKDVGDVKKDMEEVKKEVIKLQPAPEPVHKPTFDVPHDRNQNFVGRSEELGKLFEMWRPGKKGRIAVVGLGGVGYVDSSTF